MSQEPAECGRVNISEPRRFNLWALMVCGLFGVLLLLPTLAALAAVTLRGIDWLTLLIPLLTLAAATFLLPFGFGNPYLTKLLNPLKPSGAGAILVQLAFTPPLRMGFRRLFEDADDVGWLTCTPEGLEFRGDSVTLFVPAAQVRDLRQVSSGPRGLWLYPGLELQVSGFEHFQRVRFAERSCWLLPNSRKKTRALYALMRRTLVGKEHVS